MRLPGTCYLLWPTFTFVSPINHLTVQSWGLSVAECRINSPLMHKKRPGVVTVPRRIKGNMKHMWQEPWPVGNVNSLRYIEVLADKILPLYQTSTVNSRGADGYGDKAVESEWMGRREESTDWRINNEKRIFFEGCSPSRSRPPAWVKLEVPVRRTNSKQAIPVDRRARMRIREIIWNVRRPSASTLPGAVALSVLCSIISSNSRDARKCPSTFCTLRFISEG